MVARQRQRQRQRGGDFLTQELVNEVSLSEFLKDFQMYHQHLQEECYLIFMQLIATGDFLYSPSITEYEKLGDNAFSQTREAFDALMEEIKDKHDYVFSTFFPEEDTANSIAGGGLRPRDIVSIIDLSTINIKDISGETPKRLLDTIQYYQDKQQDLSLQQQNMLQQCATEYQIKTLTSMNAIYLGEVGVSCMMFCAVQNMNKIINTHLNEYQAEGGGLRGLRDIRDVRDMVRKSLSLAEESMKLAADAIVTSTKPFLQKGKTAVKLIHEDVAKMSVSQKMNIVQSLFGDLLKWGGKQVMLRLRAPEFDVTSVTDLSAFKQELLSFVGNRISQIMNKSKVFREKSADVTKQEAHLKWIVSILENIDSLLNFVKTITELSNLSATPGDMTFKYNVKASMSTGVVVNLEPSNWLKDIGESVGSLKDIVMDKQKQITDKLNIKIDDIVRGGKEHFKKQVATRQLKLLTNTIKSKEAIYAKQPSNKIIEAELGRLYKVRDNLISIQEKNEVEIEETCVQLLQEIHSYISGMNIPATPLDVISKQVIKNVAMKVDYSAFSSVAEKAAATVNNIDTGFTTYFSCIGKYLEFCPNITDVFKHIGCSLPDISTVIDKLGAISGFVSNTFSDMTPYLQAVNLSLLVIHLIVAASLNSRNNTINKERVTLADIKRTSQERIMRLSQQKTGGGIKKRKNRRGGGISSTLYLQTMTLQARKGIMNNKQSMPLVVHGHKAVLNERVKQHSMILLSVQETKREIVKEFLTSSMTSIGENFVGNFEAKLDQFMNANAQSLDVQPGMPSKSVWECLKAQVKDLIIEQPGINSSKCSSLPSSLSDEEDVYLLSAFAKYQGKQLRDSFAFDDSTPKPTLENLYCIMSQRIYMDDNVKLKKVVASVINSFNGDTALIGGRFKKKDTEVIQRFLIKKTTKELYDYALSKNLRRISPTMSKNVLITEIIKQRLHT